MNFETMSFEELETYVTAVNELYTRKKTAIQKEAWEKLIEHIREYTHKYGDISVDHGESYIDDCFLSTTPNLIITYDKENF